jgi:hypothetical protein
MTESRESAESTESEPKSFERMYYQFALLRDGYVFCILDDQNPSTFEQKNLVAITGAEVVLVHAKATFVMTSEGGRRSYSANDFDQKIFDQKNPFKYGGPKVINPPFEIEFTENVVTHFNESDIPSSFYLNEDGKLLVFPDKMSGAALANLARILKATMVWGKFDMTCELLNQASPWRSTST